ncbi:MAG: SDR family NAD(P)-dependent oxidoreductase, partial [Planctomycetota bacterium]|nr:SDR family NAD(P)-dependent oxidoreductase [Planctomycetota bacterium]
SQFDLHGKVAVVTGASRGIGRGIALGLAAAGADLVLAARSADELEAAGQEVENLGVQSLAVPTDVADLESLVALFERTTERFGGVDILVNNAGVGRRSDFLDITPEMWDYVHDINLRSVCFAMQHGIRSMLERGYGRVINIASLTTYIGMPGNSIYGASKGGVGQLTKAVATEMAPSGVTVNAIAPGFIHTDINDRMYQKPEFNAWVRSRIPMGEWGAPED